MPASNKNHKPSKEPQRSARYWAYVVGANVRRLRIQQNRSMDEMAPLLCERGFEITASGLSLMERNVAAAFEVRPGQQSGYIKVTVDRMMALAAVLGVHWDELLREDTL